MTDAPARPGEGQMTEHRKNLVRQLLWRLVRAGKDWPPDWLDIECIVDFIIARERAAELRGWEQAIEFVNNHDTLFKDMRDELARRRVETGA